MKPFVNLPVPRPASYPLAEAPRTVEILRAAKAPKKAEKAAPLLEARAAPLRDTAPAQFDARAQLAAAAYAAALGAERAAPRLDIRC